MFTTLKAILFVRLSSAERDYAYLSTMKKYATYESILKQTFYRVLYQAGISSPETFATQDDISFLVASYRKLKPRPGMPEMFRDLRHAGFEVYCCTDASPDRVKGYFDQAGVDMPAERILSAEEVGVGKPDQPVYAMARQKVGADSEGAVTVFAAAHAWDCCAARAVGCVLIRRHTGIQRSNHRFALRKQIRHSILHDLREGSV